MGDSKLLEKFREVYAAEYAFEGVVERLDTVEPVPPEHLTRGVFVRTENGTSLVPFKHKERPPLEIGDTVIVVGRNGWRGENSVLPAVLFNPKERYVRLSGNIKPYTAGSAVFLVTPTIVSLGLLMSYRLFMPIENSWIFFLGVFLSLFLIPAGLVLGEHLKRPRLYHCDEETWHLLIEEITKKFGITLTT